MVHCIIFRALCEATSARREHGAHREAREPAATDPPIPMGRILSCDRDHTATGGSLVCS
jgi:hypothetical protein